MTSKKAYRNPFMTEDQQLEQLLMKWVNQHELKPPEVDEIKRAVLVSDDDLPEIFWDTLFSNLNSSLTIAHKLINDSLVKVTKV